MYQKERKWTLDDAGGEVNSELKSWGKVETEVFSVVLFNTTCGSLAFFLQQK